jgi:CYTH domain-containing protein
VSKEIERKFLVTNDSWRASQEGVLYRQGYMSTTKERTVRVRAAGDKGYLTVKGQNDELVRLEFEYEIPLADVNEMLDKVCKKPLIEKKRYKMAYDGRTWEVDEFFGANEGLVIAEVELQSQDESFEKPDWAGQDVTDDPRYLNACLVENPYSKWSHA